MLSPKAYLVFWRSPLHAIIGLASLGLNLLLWIWPRQVIEKAAEQIPLHYNIYHGVDAYGPRQDIFLIALSGAVIWLINILLVSLLAQSHLNLARILLVLALAVQIILLVALSLIIKII